MTSTETAGVTAQQYQRAQAVISVQLVALMVRALAVLGVPMTDAQRASIAQAVLPDMLRARRRSYALAVRYMRDSARRASVEMPPIATLPPYGADAVVKALERATEPVKPAEVRALDQVSRRRARVVDYADPSNPLTRKQIGENVGATLARHAHQAGRDAVQRTADGAGDHVGWALRMNGETCWWCAMHVSRGPVFRSRESALMATGKLVSNSSRAKPRTSPWHDHCDCTPVLVFKGKPWEGQEQYDQLSKLWRESTKRKYDKRKAFAEAFGGATASDGETSRAKKLDAADTKAFARNQVEVMSKTLDRLLASGKGEDDPAVQYNRRMLAKFRTQLRD